MMATSRHETDVQVFCHNCGTSLGYVVKDGHTEWQCEHCTAEVTGEHKMTAVRVEAVEGMGSRDLRIDGPIGDEIADILNEPDIEWDVVPDYDDAGNEIGERLDPYLTAVERDDLAERIIALFREALLSRNAHQAATDKIVLGIGAGDSAVHIADEALTAALDAITGETA